MEKTIHFALFLFLVTGLLFGGCAPQEEVSQEDSASPSAEENLETSMEEKAEVVEQVAEKEEPQTEPEAAVYEDGSYTNMGTYSSPGGTDTIGVTLVLEKGLVKSVSIEDKSSNDVSSEYIELFAQGIGSVIVGKPIESITDVGAVNGSSLTPIGFNKAVLAILEDAQG